MHRTMRIVILSLVYVLVLPKVLAVDTCQKCGNVEVPQPFSTATNCGDPNYKIHCNDGVLEFPSAEGFRYKILSINLSTRTVTISPPNMQANTCYSSDFRLQGLRLDESSPFNISNRNTVMLLNCSAALLRSPLNCSSTSLCRQFEDKTVEGSACTGTLCCHYLKDSSMTSHFIRVRAGGCTAYTSVVHMRPADPVDNWYYGIELQWLPPN